MTSSHQNQLQRRFSPEELLADFARDGERIPDESALWLIDWMAYAV